MAAGTKGRSQELPQVTSDGGMEPSMQPVIAFFVLAMMTMIGGAVFILHTRLGRPPLEDEMEDTMFVQPDGTTSWAHQSGASVAITLTTTVADASETTFWEPTRAGVNISLKTRVSADRYRESTFVQWTQLPPGGRVINLTLPSTVNADAIIMADISVETRPCRPWTIDRVTATVQNTRLNTTASLDSGYVGDWLCLAPSRNPIKLKRSVPTPSERFRLAYIFEIPSNLTTSGLAILRRLFSAIHDPSDFYAINIPPSVSSRPSIDLVLAQVFGSPLPDNLVITEMECKPHHISSVEATLLMMRILLDMSNADERGGWHSLINLSTEHYPLKSREQMVAHLAAHPRRNFVSIASEQDTEELKSSRLPSKTNGGGPVAWPLDGLDYRIGSRWFVLSHGFVNDLVTHLTGALTGRVLSVHLKTVDSPLRPYRIIKMLLAGVDRPADSFFPMCLLHGPYAETWINDNLRYAVSDPIHPFDRPLTLDIAAKEQIRDAIEQPSRLIALNFDPNVAPSLELLDLISRSVAKKSNSTSSTSTATATATATAANAANAATKPAPVIPKPPPQPQVSFAAKDFGVALMPRIDQ